MAENKHIVGLFDNYDDANDAYVELLEQGFDKDDVTFAAREDVFSQISDKNGSDDVTDGAVTGATVGSLVGLAVGIGAITIPGIGPLITAGTLAGILGSTAAGAAGGGLLGVLVDMGMDETEAQGYIEGIEKGGVVVGVTVDENESDAKSIFAKHNAKQVKTHAI